jgi:sterol desaturase/sphingolipid hydroxylase (fatty acid hydroxylase superfamily)
MLRSGVVNLGMSSPGDSLGFTEAVVSSFSEYWNYTKGSFKAPDIHYPLIFLLLVYIGTFAFEYFAPKRMNYPLTRRKGFWTDIWYVIFMDYVIQVIGLYAVATAFEFVTLRIMHSVGIETPVFNLHDALPLWARFIVFFIVIDFLQWFAHLLLHRSNFFWQFHKIHHAQETLGFASTRHFHFGEYLLLKPAFWIPFTIFGFRIAEDGNYIVWYIWIAYTLTFLSHCNIKLNWGFLKYIFITPETHYWHHSRNIPGKYGVNYASSLVIWDLLFGKFYNPKDKEPILGIPENDVPDSWLGQMAYPFKAIFNMKKSPPQNKDQDFVRTQRRQEKRKKERIHP